MGDVTIVTIILIVTKLHGSTLASPSLLWPLDDRYYTREVLTALNVPSNISYCASNFGLPPSSFPNKAFELNGSADIELTVPYLNIPNQDYVFSGMFKPTETTYALFHYKPDDTLQPFKEMMLYNDGGTLKMTRLVNGVQLEDGSANVIVTLNTWHSFTFGIDVSNGKMKVQLDGNTEISIDQSDNIEIVLPGVLRVGGTFDKSQPNFRGLVTCVAFWVDDKEPETSASEALCRASSWIPDSLDCQTLPAVDRSYTGTGYFSKQHNSQISTLNQISSISTRTMLHCAAECLHRTGCWYYKFDSGNKCLLFDSTVTTWKETGITDSNLYKWTA